MTRNDTHVWPSSNFTKTPYWVYTDQSIFDQEMEQVFRGPTWNYLALECEIQNPGDFVTCFVGTTPVVVSRDNAGKIHAFVNRCAHRGMPVVRELRGNRRNHICPYHQWCYDQAGKVTGIPLLRGSNGQGGMPEDFKKEEQQLRALRVEVLSGVVFGTFAATSPSLEEFLGTAVVERLKITTPRPLRVIGYHRNTMKANWKLFSENARDAYHGPMLHPFLPTFGFINPKERGSCQLSEQGFHSFISTWNDADGAKSKRGTVTGGRVKLEDMSLLSGFKEHSDGLSLNILGIFPSTLFSCLGNSFTVRQIRPKSPGEVELLYTYFGFADDTPEQREMRRKQANLFGPAGYVSMEDIEALELLQAAIVKGEDLTSAVVEMGGTETNSQNHLMTEVTLRGFWKGYCNIMGIPLADMPKSE